ncbi:MAG: carboxypeptidase-like regulatory domain-containing protein, partial [Spirochaetota bacterium]|nr:carboxypeptidase-like regulatory domain-containing protein [Spirochaetota bacterium]
FIICKNLTWIYGIVSDHYTEQPVPNVIVRVENNTYSDFTVTNQNGYYQFTNITVGNYTIEGNKVEYYPYQQKNLTTIVNDMLVHNFDMVLLIEPVDSTTEDLEEALGLDEVTEEDIIHFLKTYGFWLFMLALFFFMYAAYKSSGVNRWFK